MRDAPHNISKGVCRPGVTASRIRTPSRHSETSTVILPSMCRYLTYIFISNSEHEIFSFKINLANPRPEVVANLINGNIEGEAINHSANVCKPSSYFPER